MRLARPIASHARGGSRPISPLRAGFSLAGAAAPHSAGGIGATNALAFVVPEALLWYDLSDLLVRE